eukprot:TRINITY_DN38179_c0_g1_i1.p1 TRINITY_DN38179_c0_g1~~TRINITY_DN38179_c0_g1_i1.p1  ORF type:complete len:592 (+),score=105.70 TRINITY_DN38179_c0_g1_i1:80-1855(+)
MRPLLELVLLCALGSCARVDDVEVQSVSAFAPGGGKGPVSMKGGSKGSLKVSLVENHLRHRDKKHHEARGGKPTAGRGSNRENNIEEVVAPVLQAIPLPPAPTVPASAAFRSSPQRTGGSVGSVGEGPGGAAWEGSPLVFNEAPAPQTPDFALAGPGGGAAEAGVNSGVVASSADQRNSNWGAMTRVPLQSSQPDETTIVAPSSGVNAHVDGGSGQMPRMISNTPPRVCPMGKKQAPGDKQTLGGSLSPKRRSRRPRNIRLNRMSRKRGQSGSRGGSRKRQGGRRSSASRGRRQRGSRQDSQFVIHGTPEGRSGARSSSGVSNRGNRNAGGGENRGSNSSSSSVNSGVSGVVTSGGSNSSNSGGTIPATRDGKANVKDMLANASNLPMNRMPGDRLQADLPHVQPTATSDEGGLGTGNTLKGSATATTKGKAVASSVPASAPKVSQPPKAKSSARMIASPQASGISRFVDSIREALSIWDRQAEVLEASEVKPPGEDVVKQHDENVNEQTQQGDADTETRGDSFDKPYMEVDNMQEDNFRTTKVDAAPENVESDDTLRSSEVDTADQDQSEQNVNALSKLPDSESENGPLE